MRLGNSHKLVGIDRQFDLEAGLAGLRSDQYLPFVLMDDNVMANVQAQAGPFPQRFGGKKGIKNS